MSIIFESTELAPSTAAPDTDLSIYTEPVHSERLRVAKKAYTTRFLAGTLADSCDGYHLLQGPSAVPAPGDIVLARVAEIGKHNRLESPVSRRQVLFVGDEILVAYGNRYAPDQFLAEIPGDLRECHLVAAGGLAGVVTAQHAGIAGPTVIEPIGLLANENGPLNLRDLAPYSLRETTAPAPVRPPVIAVLGTSMNSGKSTTLACLVRGLVNAGLNVSAGKVTGTGAGNDPLLFADAGAAKVLDFTDFGFPTTFRLDFDVVRHLFSSLIDALGSAQTDVIVVEIADGLYQDETRRLLADPLFDSLVDGVVFSAADALGAAAGVQALRATGRSVAAVSGLLTASPLAAMEASRALDVPVLDTYSLCEPQNAARLIPRREPRDTPYGRG